MARLRHFLPVAFLLEAQPELFVIVRGRAERIVAAASLTWPELAEDQRAGVLQLRVDAGGGDYKALATALTRRALAEAWAAGAERVYLGHTIQADSAAAGFWRGLGFRAGVTLEMYEIESRPRLERLERVHRLLRSQGLVPAGVEILTMLPRLVEPVRCFLAEHMPGGVLLLGAENAHYKPEHSCVLLARGEVKGVLLARRERECMTIGLRVVSPELRGGISWANALLLYHSLQAGLQSGQERCRYELNPETHTETHRLARASQARHIARYISLEILRENI